MPNAANRTPRTSLVAPGELAKETNALLAFLQRTDTETELLAAAAGFGCRTAHAASTTQMLGFVTRTFSSRSSGLLSLSDAFS